MKKVIDGLVLRVTPYDNDDRLLTVLTAEAGSIQMVAKGAKSTRSRVASMSRLFTFANFEYYERQGRRYVSGGSVNEGFFGLNQDVEGYALAAYIVQLAAEITGEGVEAEDVLRTTMNTLYLIQMRSKPLAQIKAVYEIFAACVSGFEPDLSACADCRGVRKTGGRSEGSEELWLDVMNGCLRCGGCLHAQNGSQPIPEFDPYSTKNILLPLDPSALATLRYVVRAEPQRRFAFSLAGKESMDCLSRVTEIYLLNHLERSFDALDFYRAVLVSFKDGKGTNQKERETQ